MVAVAIIRTYFRVVINLSAETAQTIINKVLNDFDYLVEFTEADMKTLCTTIHGTGEMIINPRDNSAEKPPHIRDQGQPISMVS